MLSSVHELNTFPFFREYTRSGWLRSYDASRMAGDISAWSCDTFEGSRAYVARVPTRVATIRAGCHAELDKPPQSECRVRARAKRLRFVFACCFSASCAVFGCESSLAQIPRVFRTGTYMYVRHPCRSLALMSRIPQNVGYSAGWMSGEGRQNLQFKRCMRARV